MAPPGLVPWAWGWLAREEREVEEGREGEAPMVARMIFPAFASFSKHSDASRVSTPDSRHSRAEHSTKHYCTEQHSTVKHCAILYYTVPNSTVQNRTAEYSTVQSSIVPYNTVHDSTVVLL